MGHANARLRRSWRGGGPLSEGRSPTPRATGAPAPIRDAATLVIVDSATLPPRLLVGRRAGGHVFMAGRVVFPGGRLDPSDLKLAASHAIGPHETARLTARVRSRFDARRACALALAAIRETWEETGIMVGRPGTAFASSLPAWRDFTAENVAPDPGRLVPFARAITPPGEVRRYDTRFFAVCADAVAHRVAPESRPTDEFDRVSWLTIEELEAENLHPITQRILGELVERLGRGTLFDASAPMPLYRRGKGSFRRDML